jgi:molybdopterin converting factor small subunit
MQVTARMGPPLSQLIGEDRVTLTLPEGGTVADLLNELRQRFPEFEAGLRGYGLLRQPTDRVLYRLFVNTTAIPFDQAGMTLLADGDRVFIPFAFSGG